MANREKLAEFVAWTQKHITGDEKGQAQIFLDRLFQSFGQPGCLDVGGTTEFRIRKSDEEAGGTTLKPQRGLAYQPRVETRGPGMAFLRRVSDPTIPTTLKVVESAISSPGFPLSAFAISAFCTSSSALDTAVLDAYAFSPKKDLLAQLLALNQTVAARIEKGEPVVSPGVPKNYPGSQNLVTTDCIPPPALT
jgi:hypothetical protein